MTCSPYSLFISYKDLRASPLSHSRDLHLAIARQITLRTQTLTLKLLSSDFLFLLRFSFLLSQFHIIKGSVYCRG
ncbi:unnamed protein product [Allacma fusca]|uniref:Uncharacterized protein n=1 Tax=Allacma fusca TaxID=39272 RepID=A0A8J2L0Y3_9HEXA|nr:unnamed protein product [Allacma fusca]